MKAFTALYLANAREFVRDRLAVVITIIMPLAFAGFFGMIFGQGDQAAGIRLGLAVQDNGPLSQQLVAILESPSMAESIGLTVADEEKLVESLRAGDLHAVLVLPAGLTERTAAGEAVNVPVYYDPSSQSSTGMGLGFVRSFLNQANLVAQSAPELITVDERSVMAEKQNPAAFYAPSMLGLAMLWLGVFGTAMPLVEMREKKVLRRLAVAPLSTRTVLAAQVGWRVTVGMVQTILFVAFSVLVLGLILGRQAHLILPIALLGAVTFVTLGYFIAALSPTSEAAIAIAQVVNFAMTLLSGSMFEPEFLPAALRPAMYIMPLTYLSDALRQVMVGFRPLFPLEVDVAVLAGLLLVLVPLTIKFWRWE